MLRHRIEKHKLDFNDDGTPIRGYSNLAPKDDRPTYNDLQINEEYKGHKGIVWTPLDLPKLEVDTDHVHDLLYGDALDKRFPNAKFHCGFGAGNVLFLKQNFFTHPYGNGDWWDWVDYELPHVKEYIEKLPFTHIRQLAFVAPPKETIPHYDEPFSATPILRKQSPSCYRIRWSRVTEPEKEVFFMTKDSGATKIYPVLPEETDAFVYDGSVYEHGADEGFKMRDRCQIIISGILDVEKHNAILDRSIKRFPDHVLYDHDFR